MTLLRNLTLALLALLAASAPALAPAQPRFDFDRTPGHLSKAVQAPHQALSLDLDPDSDRFDGETTLTLALRRPQTELQMHAHQLTARRSVLITASGERALTVQADEKAQTWRLLPADGRPLPAGRATLRLAWSGRVQATGSGLFQAGDPAQGAGQRMLATQLQAVYARTVFPAFDEPAFRTRFTVTVRAPAGYQVLSNMPAVTTRVLGSHVQHRFATTPPMPAYLLAVSVGRFEALAGRAAGVPLRIVTAPGKRAQGRYALAATRQLLPYYTAYFGLPYALPKLDQLAVPSSRDGAMEDWGLISYTESSLLFDPATGSTGHQRGIYNTVAHEVAHQWFGNLVTAASWEEIWLNEAFATWMADKASAHFNPQWQLGLRRRSEIDQTMERDGGPATRAIRSGAVLEDRVSDVFDDITYTKGGAVLGMLEQWIGEDRFRRGLAAYMRERRLSNATAGDLWFHIGRASGRDVAAVAASWTDQPGFPVVDVDSRCDGGRTRVDLAQRPFSSGGAPRPGRWQIPLVLDHGGRTHRVLLQQERQTLTLPGCPATPLVVNPQGVGFYRVAYAPAAQAALAAAFLQLPAAAQITLMSDSFARAQSGEQPMAAWLDLVAQLPQARGPAHAALMGQAQAGLRLLGDAFHGSPAAAPLAAATRALLAPELQALGWAARPGEDSETEALRAGLIRDLAAVDDTDVLARAQALFDDDEAGRAPLPAAVRAAVIGAVGRAADGRHFDALKRRLLNATSDDDRWRFASALARVRDAGRAREVLALSLSDALPANVATRLPGMVGEARWHGDMAYEHVVAHWSRLAERSGGMFGARAWLLGGVAWNFNTVPQAQRLLTDQQRLAGEPGAAVGQQVASRIELLAAIQRREAQRLQPALQALAGTRP